MTTAAPPANGRPAVGIREMEAYLQEVDSALRPYLDAAEARVPPVPGLREGVVYQIRGGGKRVRAALCATVCEIFCGRYQPALPFAAAVEHLQNFTLVHDDIADGDHHRRGQQSAWRRFGLAHGVNIGDVFVPLAAGAILDAAYAPALKLRLLSILADYGLTVAEGQGLDINLRGDDAPSEDAYFACSQRKTGAFLAMAAVGGGTIGGADEAALDQLNRFANAAGVAFQIKDDLIDLIGGKGRPSGSDIAEGKRTLLFVYAWPRVNDADRRRLVQILNKPRVQNTPGEIDWVRELYIEIGAVRYAEARADSLVDEALEALVSLPENQAKYRFIRLARFLSRRRT